MLPILRFARLNWLLHRLRDLLERTEEVRYYSVPVWRPWRDF
jgi:hypothetical protein